VIVDFHTHIDEAAAFGWFDPPEKLIPLLDAAGIDLAVAMTYTDVPGLNPDVLEYLAECVSRFPDRLVGFARLNPNYGEQARQLLRRAAEMGMKGLKLHPTTTLAHPASPPTIELLRLCGDLGLPALFHCGDDPYTTPQAIADAARMAPDTAVVLGHMGGYFHVEDAIRAAESQGNLYLETSAMPYPTKIAEAVRRLGGERIIFGSDGPGCNPALEIQKICQLELEGGIQGAILGGNALRLLNRSSEA